MLVFDKKTLRCVIPPTDDCDIPTTTTQAPEIEDPRLQLNPNQRQNQQQDLGNNRNNQNQNF